MTTCSHTPAPDGYAAWHDWAERKGKTHTQHRCPNCGLWAIWKPKKKSKSDCQPEKGGEGNG